MSRRVLTLLTLSAFVACGLMVAWFCRPRQPPPEDWELWSLGQALPDVDFGMPTLDLEAHRLKSSVYVTPIEERRRLEHELANRPDHGPIRCSLRLRHDGTKEHWLVVELKNDSQRHATIRNTRYGNEDVTFVFRDSDERVVGSFCFRSIVSIVGVLPLVLAPGESWSFEHSLFVSMEYGCPRLAPGAYSAEAIFKEDTLEGARTDGVYARSERVPFWVR